MKIAHCGDIHLDSTTLAQVAPALEAMIQQILDAKPDLCLMAGDIFVKRGYLEPKSVHLAKDAFLRLADEMPVILLVGNHDVSHSWNKPDLITAEFTRKDGSAIHPNISVVNRPALIEPVDGIQVAAIPSPSKYLLLSQDETATAKNVEQLISQKLVDVLQGLFAQMKSGVTRILLYHGTVAGGIADNERLMDTEKEISLPRHVLLERFNIVACGHLHRPQEVGNAVYCGAIAPLRFDAVGVEPSWVLWDTDLQLENSLDPNWTGTSSPAYCRQALPVAHQLLAIEVTEGDFIYPDMMPDETDPTQGVLRQIASVDVTNAKVRLRYKLPKSIIEQIDAKEVEKALAPAFWYKIDMDTTEDSAIRVEGLKRGMELSDMIDLYATVDKEAEPHLEELKELGAEVDRLMTPEQRLLLKGVRYKPLRVWWKNWKPLGEGEIALSELGRLVCIDGDNTLGKSNLIEIEPFVMWGPKNGLLRGEPLKKVIRDGCQDCRVGMEIEADGKRYKIERTVGLTKRSASSTLTVSESVNGDWQPGSWTQKELEQLVGSRDLFLATRFARQGDIDRILDMKPSVLKDTLQDAFNVGVFEIRKEIANEMLKKLTKEVEKAESDLERLETEAGKLREAEERYEQAESGKSPLEAEVEKAQEKLEDLKAKLATQEMKAQKIKELEKLLAQRTSALHENRHKIASLSNERNILQDSLELRKDITVKVAEIGVLRKCKDEEWGKVQLAREIKDNIAASKEELRLEQQAHDRKVSKFDIQIATAEESIEHLTKRTGILGKIDTFGCDRMDCPAIASAVAAKEELEKTRTECTQLREQQITVAGEVVAPGIEDEIETYEKELKEIGADEAKWKQIHQDLGALLNEGWEDKAKDLAVAETKLEETGKRIEELKEDDKKQLKVLETTEAQWAKAAEEASEEARVQLIGDVSVVEHVLSSKRKDLSDLQRELGQLDAEIKRAKEAAEKLKTLKTELTEKRRRRSILGIFVRAMGRDGIPFLFLEVQLPKWAAYANDFLSVEGATEDWRLSVKVDPIRDLVKGSPKSEVTVWFTDEKGTHPLQSASGFQRNALGSALRASLAKLMAELTGSTIDIFVHDEAWSAFRENRVFLAQSMIRKYAQTFGQVVFVSHQAFMSSIADSRISLEGDVANGTRVMVER